MKNKINNLIILLSVICAQGCATFSTPPTAPAKRSEITADQFIQIVDRSVRQAKALDHSSIAVKNFPYLRSNRFLASFKEKTLNEEPFRVWLDLMKDLRLESIEKEINNLPDESLVKIQQDLGTELNRRNLLIRYKDSMDTLLLHDEQHPYFYDAVQKAVRNKSQYYRLQKIFGFYPLFYLPTLRATKRAYDKFLEWHTKDFEDVPTIGKLIIFSPPNNTESLTEYLNLYQSIPRNSLGMPIPNADILKQLARFFAPTIHQDIDGEFDRFGRVTWQNNAVKIDYDQPTVYYYLTYAYVKKTPVMQLNYVYWYKGRLGPNAPRLERGDLDGMTIRITIDTDGIPIMVDTTNSCGCYHFFVPNKQKIISLKPQRGLDPLVVRYLPDQYPDKPLHVRMNTGWHQIVRIKADTVDPKGQKYQLRAYDELESLPHSDDRRENVFDSKGIMKDSHRIEPYLFFPSGVRKVGYMRQRHNHPIKLIGEAHFSDPYLINQNFLYPR